MEYYIGCDAHKKYSVFAGISEAGEIIPAQRVEHNRESYRSFLQGLPPGCRIAVESVGNWYWMVDEMEKAGHVPTLTHPAKAKLMMGQLNKTDKLDARGLAVLSRNGTLPAVWIPPGELRDQRELPRMRMAMSQVRTKFKNRIHSTFDKYGITFDEVSDLFSRKGRKLLEKSLDERRRPGSRFKSNFGCWIRWNNPLRRRRNASVKLSKWMILCSFFRRFRAWGLYWL